MKIWMIGLLPAVLLAAEPPKTYTCLQTDADIKIDGKLSEHAWEKAAWTDAFVDIEGAKKPAPRFSTKVKMLWDDQYLYIGAEMEEPQVWATITKRDSVIFHDNDFEVFLDPDGDNHKYGELEINALNTQWDLFLPKPYKDGGKALTCWDIEGLESAVHVDGTVNDAHDVDKGWTVEIAIPWRGLEMCTDHNRPPQPGEYWRMNFSRVEWDTQNANGQVVKTPDKAENDWVWSPQGVIDMHRPEMWGIVVFVRDSALFKGLPPDFHWDLRETAHAIYYGERDYFKKKNKWTTSMRELDLKTPSDQEVKIRKTLIGWNAAVMPKSKPGEKGLIDYHIRDDAYLWFTRHHSGAPSDTTSKSE